MAKRDTTVPFMTTANTAAYLKLRASQQERSVSQYVDRLVEADMAMHGDPGRDYTQSKDLRGPDSRTTVRPIFPTNQSRKPAQHHIPVLRKSVA